jgi:hypothetical protein
MNKLKTKLFARYYLWRLRDTPFEKVLQDYSKNIEKRIIKGGKNTNKIDIDDEIFNIWSKIQNSWLKRDLDNVGKNYSKEDFVRDLKNI